MTHTRITFKLTPDDVRNAVKKIEKFKIGYKRKVNRTLDIVADTCTQYLLGSYYSPLGYEGPIDVAVNMEKMPDGYKVIASGSTLFFLEYGTGIYAGPDPSGQQAVPAYPGSWSEGHEQQFSTKGYWMYNRRIQFGSEPAYAFFYLNQSIHEIVQEAIREVFG